jgi:type II secretory pathway component PulF
MIVNLNLDCLFNLFNPISIFLKDFILLIIIIIIIIVIIIIIIINRFHQQFIDFFLNDQYMFYLIDLKLFLKFFLHHIFH